MSLRQLSTNSSFRKLQSFAADADLPIFGEVSDPKKVNVHTKIYHKDDDFVLDAEMDVADYFYLVMRDNRSDFEGPENPELEQKYKDNLPDAVTTTCSTSSDCGEDKVCVEFLAFGGAVPYCFDFAVSIIENPGFY